MPEKSTQTAAAVQKPLVRLRLEYWNGVDWEISERRVHRNMSLDHWISIKPHIKVNWLSTPWRVIAETVLDQSTSQPNASTSNAEKKI